MALITKKAAIGLNNGCCICVRSAWARSWPVTTPRRAAIDCNNMVAITENNNVQISAKPKLAPAMLAVVIVPWPIKAAVTSRPDPNRISNLRVCVTFVTVFSHLV